MYGTCYVKSGEVKLKVFGTSMAAPLNTGYLSLLKIIYDKKFPTYKGKYGKYSPFMEYVIDNWLDTLPEHMTMTTGLGMLSIIAPNKSEKIGKQFDFNHKFFALKGQELIQIQPATAQVT